jgi:hypothetical protein
LNAETSDFLFCLPRLSLLMSPGELHMEAARNNSCVITIVGYHGNSVYRVIASIPVLVTCGRFPWKAPTHVRSSIVAQIALHYLRQC